MTGYYELANSWTHADSKEIPTLIQVPVIVMNRDLELYILRGRNIIRSDLSLAIISRSTNAYRLLSNLDFFCCTETAECMICQKREITIQIRQECSLHLANCDDWANLLVHDVPNTQILVSYYQNQTAFLSCDKGKNQELMIPNSAVSTIPAKSRLKADRFAIRAISKLI